MAKFKELWIALRTADWPDGGTDANLFIEFLQSGKSFMLPDQPGNDTEISSTTSYLFHVENIGTEDFAPGTVILRNDNSGKKPGWRCESVLVIGVGEDGKYYLLVAMEEINRWLAADEPEGLTLTLDILKRSEIGLPRA